LRGVKDNALAVPRRGCTTGPRLHFIVFQTIDDDNRLSLATRFHTRLAVLNKLGRGAEFVRWMGAAGSFVVRGCELLAKIIGSPLLRSRIASLTRVLHRCANFMPRLRTFAQITLATIGG
jgi:hypothetical protein